ncbi:MAG: ABC transporter ATP-binding protein [Defluviitaleaceae bacterium]|nr:ABC transporter ATP-binding protein [Defluviitaleaceae bacterium]MCL2275052.1 ABC transporter ATP-binding protein [Defluviitaleaceae bacterium]
MIEVKNLTKQYGHHTAINDLNFSIDAGEIVGFLGPNGAGKTTTMNIMTGFIAATRGDVTINGLDIIAEPEEAKKQIGYLPDTPPVYGDMRVDEYLSFVADIKGVKRTGRKEMLTDIKQKLHIDDVSRRLIKNLSRGYRQRVGLAQAMVGRPRVIIMDEPTIGLDPKQIIEMREVVKGLGRYHTVILSSHIMQEVSAVCDRVMIINKGRIVAQGTPESLSHSLNKSAGKIQIRVKADATQVREALKEFTVIRHINVLESREAGTIDIELAGDEGVDIREPIFRCFAKNNLPLLLMKSMDLSLEEIFLTLTGDLRTQAMGYESPEEEVMQNDSDL